ncbi:MAG TPA: MDR family MFS transporter [Ktedonobacterales bacterium]|jgi:EmrB/QacA subfamily drug resistance transporter
MAINPEQNGRSAQNGRGGSNGVPGAAPSGRRLRGWALGSVLASLMLTLFLAALDSTIVNTALPTIARDLHGFDRYTWPSIAYLLTSTTMIPIVGKLSDQFGRKWFLMSGVVIFLLGSALCGATPELASALNVDPMNLFIFFRGFQGIGGGMLFSLVFTSIGDIFPPAERAQWQGLFSGVFGLASVFGPTAGGYITDTWGWQWIFYINLPLGIIALILLFRYLPADMSVRSAAGLGWAGVRRIDVWGAATAAGATVCLVLGLNWGGKLPPSGYAWDSPQVIGVLVAAAILLLVFLVIERYFAAEPILPLDLFKNPIFRVGSMLALMVGMALFALVLYLPLYIQGVLGYSATNSGVVITPLTLALAIGAAVIGQVIARVGRYQWVSIIGACVLIVGVFLLTRMTATTSLLEVSRNMIVVGAGLGMIQPVLTLAVQNAIPRARLGVGTGAVTYLRSMGQLLGVALVGAIANNAFTNQLNTTLPEGIRQLPASAQDAATDPNNLQRVIGNPPAQHDAIQAAITQADKTVVPQAVQSAVAKATANVPPGPTHNQTVAAITQQVTEQVTQAIHIQITDALNQLFVVAKDALLVSIQAAFWTALVIAVIILILTFFLKDVPLKSWEAPASAQGGQQPGEIGGAGEPSQPIHTGL